tara:strand:+ start:34282 stop:34563 length:282 start_codon:yes stop_codon:yes gene_type:complete
MANTKLFITLAAQAAAIVWWASNLSSQVQHNDFQIQMMAKDVEKHAVFVRDWPVGKLGALPDDVRQNLHIQGIQKEVEKLTEKIDTLKAANAE